MRRTVVLLLALVWVFASAPARAHDADIVFFDATIRGAKVEESATLTGATLAMLAPVDQDGDGYFGEDEIEKAAEAIDAGFWESVPLSSSEGRCTREKTEVTLEEGYIQLSAEFTCPSEADLRQEYRILSVLPPGYRVILETEGETTASERFAEGAHQLLYLRPRPGEAEQQEDGPQGFLGWVLLGAEHIFQGYDHLAFLGALLLVASTWKRLLWMVTAFTLAHSITLGATALGLLTLPPSGAQWVEVAIAASVVIVAVENLAGVREKWRPLVTFGFGLIHGFGFASVLASYGLGDSKVAALAGFNLGVELGQATIVAVLFPLLRLLRRRERWHRRVVLAGSGLIAAVGLYWFVQRLL